MLAHDWGMKDTCRAMRERLPQDKTRFTVEMMLDTRWGFVLYACGPAKFKLIAVLLPGEVIPCNLVRKDLDVADLAKVLVAKLLPVLQLDISHLGRGENGNFLGLLGDGSRNTRTIH
jgi:hypothetical protein